MCNSTLDDGIVGAITETFPDLITLDLSSSKITGVTVKGLVKGCSHLQTLKLNDCTEVWPDAIQWARSKGINVECNRVPLGWHEPNMSSR